VPENFPEQTFGSEQTRLGADGVISFPSLEEVDMIVPTEITAPGSVSAPPMPQRPIPCAPPRLPLVIGLGNLYLCDDGAGVHLARQLRTTLQAGSAVCIDGGLMSLGLFPYLEVASALILLHCADIAREPGSVEVLEGEALEAYLRRPRPRSIQERGLADLLELAQRRACLPPRMALVCIQPRRRDWGEALSLPVSRALPLASSHVKALLARWQGN